MRLAIIIACNAAATCQPADVPPAEVADTGGAVLEWDDDAAPEAETVTIPCVSHAVTTDGAEVWASRASVPGWALGVEARIDGEPVPWHRLGAVLVEATCVEGQAVAWTWLPW